MDIKKIAMAARLNLSEGEERSFSEDMDNILSAFSELEKVNTEGVEPAFQPVELKNVTREDRVIQSLGQKDALSNTKNTEKGFFKGPKAV